jgi:hypothetical protein
MDAMSIRLRELALRERRGAYVLRVSPVGMDNIFVATDNNLGHVMSAWSAVLKEIQAQATGVPRSPTNEMTGTITLDHFAMVPLTIHPWRWRIEMTSGPYRYECNVDSELQSVTDAFSTAMKFFGMKYGICTVFPDETWSTEQARASGLLEGSA